MLYIVALLAGWGWGHLAGEVSRGRVARPWSVGMTAGAVVALVVLAIGGAL